VSYLFKASETFWKKFYALPDEQKSSIREKWEMFKDDPFHPSLGTHKIHKLSAVAKQTIYSVVIEGNLRVLFKIDGDTVNWTESWQNPRLVFYDSPPYQIVGAAGQGGVFGYEGFYKGKRLCARSITLEEVKKLCESLDEDKEFLFAIVKGFENLEKRS
jgi:hypothetical protein